MEEGHAVATKAVRRFIYHYNGYGTLEDVEEDLTGEMEMPSIGSIIHRHDREWRVFHVIAPVSPNGTVPFVRVFLSDVARAKGTPPISLRKAS